MMRLLAGIGAWVRQWLADVGHAALLFCACCGWVLLACGVLVWSATKCIF